MTLNELKQELLENDYSFTDENEEAIWILEDGTKIDGEFDMGYRGQEHRLFESILDIDRYDDDFWDVVTRAFNVVMVIPETEMILLKEWQLITSEQQKIINSLNYQIEYY